ncbi:hypothetical protein ABTZ46_01785 [Nocardioides sp. NPDC126508]
MSTVSRLICGLLALTAAACGSSDDGAGSAASTTAATSEKVEIRTSVSIAPTPGAEPIATGEVLEGSTLGGSAFCSGGTLRDTHGSSDPEVPLIARTITCPDGKVQMELTPDVGPDLPQGEIQTGTWTFVGGTGAFKGLSGSGEMEIANDPEGDGPAHETFTGTVTR